MHIAEGTPRLSRNNLMLALLLMALLLAACDGASGSATATPELVVVDVISLDTTRDWYVETTGDDGNSCTSVAEACLTIEAALDKASPFDEIYFGAGTFSAERIFVEKNISFIGMGMGVSIIRGTEGVGAALISPDPVRVVFRDLTVTNAGGGSGGALYFTDPLSEMLLTRVHLLDNLSYGVSAAAPLHIQDSIFEGNQDGGVIAGGLIERSQFLNNLGPGVSNLGHESSVLIIRDSHFEGNISNRGSGIESTVTTTVERSTFTRNRPQGDSVIAPSVISQLRGSLTLRNVTISGNPLADALVMNFSNVDISFSTIVRNRGGVWIRTSPGSMVNNLMAENRLSDCNIGESIAEEGNIYQFSLALCDRAIDGEVLIDDLADNGGFTMTHALQAGSPAIDAATSCISQDQRGAGRPAGDGCDVGAYELGGGIASEAIESGGTPEILVFETLTPAGPGTVEITTDTLCLMGPSASAYEVVNTLTKGLVGQLIGAGETGQGNDDWLVLSHPNFADTTCWVDAEFAEPSIPFSEMRLIFVPLAPTATPKPTREPGPDATNVPPAPTCDPQQGPCP